MIFEYVLRMKFDSRGVKNKKNGKNIFFIRNLRIHFDEVFDSESDKGIYRGHLVAIFGASRF